MLTPPNAPGQGLGFRAGFTRMSDGNMSYRFGPEAQVLANRRSYFLRNNLAADRFLTFFTEHGDDIYTWEGGAPVLDALRSEKVATTDAILTRTPGTGVFLTFADCVPVALYDRAQHLLLFAHIGWRSMAMGFTGKVLRRMLDVEGCRVEDLVAVVGPCIRQESYLFEDPVQATQAVWKPYLKAHPDGRLGIDLLGFCKAEMAAAGLQPGQVTEAGIDTAADPGMFSHYAATEGGRSEKQGRFIFWAWLADRD